MVGINRCSPEPRVTFQNESVTCESWGDGCELPAGRSNTSFCTVQFGAHAWPGFPEYANGTPDMHASTEIWRFYEGVLRTTAAPRRKGLNKAAATAQAAQGSVL